MLMALARTPLLVLLLAAALAATGPSRAQSGDLRSLAAGIEIAAPAGWASWCHARPGDCLARAAERVALTPFLARLLDAVFAGVNRRVVPRPEAPGRDEWRVIDGSGSGDCEDFALTYRAALLAVGLPPGALELALVLTEEGEAHIVLTVATSGGTLVLDNRAPQPLPWQRLPYRWLALQGVATAGWQLLDAPGDAGVAPARIDTVPAASPPATARQPAASQGTVDLASPAASAHHPAGSIRHRPRPPLPQ